MSRDLRNIVIGAIITSVIFLFFILRGCEGYTPGRDRSSSTIDTVAHETDTITKTKIDTLRDTIKIVRHSSPDTIIKRVDSSKSYHTIETSYDDSLLEAKVSTDIRGEFIGQSMDYSVISPREKIFRVDTVLIRDSIHTERTITKNPWQLGIGTDIQGSKTYFDFAPVVSLEKDGVQIKYGYNVLNKTHEIGLQKKIDLN